MTWQCHRCTFENYKSTDSCEICLTKRIIDLDDESDTSTIPKQQKKRAASSDDSIEFIKETTCAPKNVNSTVSKSKKIKLGLEKAGILLPPQYLTTSRLYYEGRLVMTKSPYSRSRFSLPDLILPNCKRILLSAMCVDDEWVARAFPAGIPTIIIRPAPENNSGAKAMIISRNLKYVFPPLKGFGCMHTKLIILWHDEFIRIAIPSANLLDFDWDTIENSLFYQDFPKSTETYKSTWIDDLKAMLGSMGMNTQELDLFNGFDYRKAIGQLVVSIPGSHKSDKYGLKRLGSITATVEHDRKPVLITAQVSGPN